MRSDYSYLFKYSYILTDFAWARCPLYLLISCVVLLSLNEFIEFSMKVDIYPSFFVHPCPIQLLLGSFVWLPNRERKAKVKTKGHRRNQMHDRNCTINLLMSNPVQCLGRGLFIPPTLLQYSKNASSIFPEVKWLQQGYLVISTGWTIRFAHFYLSHMLHDVV